MLNNENRHERTMKSTCLKSPAVNMALVMIQAIVIPC